MMPQFSTLQINILECVGEGLRNRDIAERIGKTENTVKNYLRRIFDLAGMGNRTELALWYVAHRNEILQSGK